MKKQIVIAGAVLFCSFVFGTVEGVAQQIFNQFRQPVLVTGKPYRDLNDCGGITKNIIPATSFTLPPTGIVNRDDGYSRINFPGGLRFSYAGVQYNNVFVSVNGFLTFDGTKLVPAKESAGLFTNSASYPDNVIAPFWGDHYYRTPGADVNNGYMPSEISWALDYDRDENCEVIDSTRPCLIVQWRNLNINDASVNSSVGNFQARLYFSNADSNWQGDIEFAYGQVGGNPNTSNNVVVTRGATVGIKGNSGFPGFISDFWNGLLWAPAADANRRTDSTTRWQPSDGRSDAVIRFGAILYFTFDNWGFGDVDLSGGKGERHENMTQNRRVTTNDARTILRSIVTGVKLDSVWKRPAYQGDVNHSGRFYYTRLNRDFTADSLDPVSGQIVIWRRTIDVDQFTGAQVLRVLNEGQGLYGVGGRAPDVSALNQIYYEVTEYDAALIMRYLSGRLPYLPWVYDNDTTGPDFGKVGSDVVADNVLFGAPASIGNGLVQIPVYVNAAHNGAFGVRFSSNASIVGVSPVTMDNATVGADFSNHTAVLIGNGTFAANNPIAFVTVKEQDAIEMSNLRFNEQDRGSISLKGLEQAAFTVTSFPNPMTTEASVAVNVPTSSMVTVKVFDVFGNEVQTIFADQAQAGLLNTVWNGTNAAGLPVAPGAYFVRVVGEGFSASTKVTVAR